MFRGQSRLGCLWILAIVCAALGPGVLAGEASAAEDAAITIGTYKPGAVFEQSAGRAELMKLAQSLRQEMSAAQQAQDRQKMMKVQQKFQKERQRITEAFEKEVSDALPEIAEAAGVKIIAVEVAYSADDVAVKDVTKQVIEVVGEKAEGQKLPMPLPGKKRMDKSSPRRGE